MRMHAFHRTELLVGQEGYARLQGASALVVGLGGVGSYAAEALARAGVGHLTLVDFDRVCLTNLNRQLHATRETVGQSKAELMAARAQTIAPKADVRAIHAFYDASRSDEILDRDYDIVLDCIDHLETKLHLLETCVRRGLPTWAAMGAGGRMDPTRIQVTDLSKTHTDPFARLVRKHLRQRGIEEGLTVVWTDEPPNDLDQEVQDGFKCICPDKANSPASCDRRFQVQGTVPWMPAMFGLTMAGAAVNAVLGREVATEVRAPKRQPMAKDAPGRPTPERQRELRAAALAGLQPRRRRADEAPVAGDDTPAAG